MDLCFWWLFCLAGCEFPALGALNKSDSGSSDQTLCSTVVITNLSKTDKISVFLDSDPTVASHDRRDMIANLENDVSGEYQEFKKNRFQKLSGFAVSGTFTKPSWGDFHFITLFKLTRQSNSSQKHENCIIHDRRKFYRNYLYYQNGKLHETKSVIQCNINSKKQPHPLSIIQENNSGEYKCAFCDNTRGIQYRCKQCGYQLCEPCCHLIICEETPLGLDDLHSITKVEQSTISMLQVTCSLSNWSLAKEKKFLLKHINDNNNSDNNNSDNNNSDNNKLIKYEIKATICQKGMMNKLDLDPQYHDFDAELKHDFDQAPVKKFNLKLPDNLFDQFTRTQLDCQVQLRVIDQLNEIHSLPMISDVKIIDSNFYQCTFTTLNGIGRLGPTVIDGYYTGKDNENDTRLMASTPGIQYWRVPLSGWWKIVCHGAQGGHSKFDNVSRYGGKGATVGGLIKLYKNDIFKIICGQIGESSDYNLTSYSRGGGGGGATWFVLFKVGKNNPSYNPNASNYSNGYNVENAPLMVAAGGNGAGRASAGGANGIDGLCDVNQDRKDYGGYNSTGHAARGSSFKDDFDSFKSFIDKSHWEDIDYKVCNGKSFKDGVVGGLGYISKYGNGCDGGFGGGGGSRYDGGGGGGYIGGIATSSTNYKFGALSWIDISCQENEERVMISGNNRGNGKIEASYVSQIIHLQRDRNQGQSDGKVCFWRF